jgi:hypothetical protein
MKSAASCLFAIASAAALFAAPPLFTSATESKWTVTQGSKSIGTITLLTSSSGTRAEFRPLSGSVSTFLGGNNSVWMRSGGQDTDVATISATTPESTTALALLLPFTPMKTDAVETRDGKATMYKYRGAKATYTWDARGPSKVDIDDAGKKYTLTRISLTASSADASNFTIRPKTSAGSRLARLSGNLLGSSDTSVSGTAGGRGAGTKGLKLKDGGDYSAVEKLENRDTNWRKKNLDSALEEFQKTGKVGKAREGQ